MCKVKRERVPDFTDAISAEEGARVKRWRETLPTE